MRVCVDDNVDQRRVDDIFNFLLFHSVGDNLDILMMQADTKYNSSINSTDQTLQLTALVEKMGHMVGGPFDTGDTWYGGIHTEVQVYTGCFVRAAAICLTSSGVRTPIYALHLLLIILILIAAFLISSCVMHLFSVSLQIFFKLYFVLFSK